MNHQVVIVLRKHKAFGIYDWDQARWECSCGGKGHWGNEKKAEKNGEEHRKKKGVNSEKSSH